MRESARGRKRMLSAVSWVAPCFFVAVGGIYYHYRTTHNSMPVARPVPAGSVVENDSSGAPSPRDPTSPALASPERPTNPVPKEILVDPAFDEIIRSLETEAAEAFDKDEQVRLAKFELTLRQQMAAGWRPPGKELELPLTDEEIASMPTRELGIRLWAIGLHARELITFDRPNSAMKRLEVCYQGYAELFRRPDLWEALRDGVVAGSSQLDATKSDRENLSFVMTLTSLPETYGYPPIRRSILGHEKELMQAHITALLKVKDFVLALAHRGAPMGTAALVTPRTVIILSQTALAMGKPLSPALTLSARQSLSQFEWREGCTGEDIPRYVDMSVTKLREFID
jgi:hypothetical protein